MTDASLSEQDDWPITGCTEDLAEMGPQEAYEHLKSDHGTTVSATYDLFLAFRQQE